MSADVFQVVSRFFVFNFSKFWQAQMERLPAVNSLKLYKDTSLKLKNSSKSCVLYVKGQNDCFGSTCLACTVIL